MKKLYIVSTCTWCEWSPKLHGRWLSQ